MRGAERAYAGTSDGFAISVALLTACGRSGATSTPVAASTTPKPSLADVHVASSERMVRIGSDRLLHTFTASAPVSSIVTM